MHADSESCRNNRCARTPRTGGDETTNLPVTPGILHTLYRLASKRGRSRVDFCPFRFILTFVVTSSFSQLPLQWIVNSAPGVPASHSLPEILSSSSPTLQLDDGIGDAPVLNANEI